MNFNNFTIKSQEVGRYAVEMAQSNGQQVVKTPHLLKWNYAQRRKHHPLLYSGRDFESHSE